MTTTELIELLKSVEFGASGRSREISFKIPSKSKTFISNPDIKVSATGDGIAGAEVTLNLIIGNK